MWDTISSFCEINLTCKRNYFKHLTTSIVGQQLSVKSAAAINKRFLNHFRNKPTPELVAKTNLNILRSLGLSEAKSKYIKDLSSKILDRTISLNGISKKSDSEILNELTKVKGIGPWTVDMFLIFTLGRQNVLASGDLGIKKSIMLNYNLKKLPTDKNVIRLSKKMKWSPFNSYAMLYLWKSLDEG
ncbi:MAG: hypothetical protein V3V16_04800 [Melioribacteraceae bacterium]